MYDINDTSISQPSPSDYQNLLTSMMGFVDLQLRLIIPSEIYEKHIEAVGFLFIKDGENSASILNIYTYELSLSGMLKGQADMYKTLTGINYLFKGIKLEDCVSSLNSCTNEWDRIALSLRLKYGV
jgi:hypothetical protein